MDLHNNRRIGDCHGILPQRLVNAGLLIKTCRYATAHGFVPDAVLSTTGTS